VFPGWPEPSQADEGKWSEETIDHSGVVWFLSLLSSLRQNICRHIVAYVRTDGRSWTRRVGRQLKMMPDVEVRTYLHQSWPSLVEDIGQLPSRTHSVVVGYSLGANSSVFVANKAKYVDLIIALQPSMLSWNPPVTGSVGRMIEIYNPNPWMTFGGMGSRTGNRSRPRRRTLIAHDTPDLPTSRHERHALATDYRGQYRENVQQQQHPMEP
jgi:hypothetical protein